jgi:diguanylate cyclase (GGDEF)-like protein
MSAFLGDQIDFILFFYGLAFLLLGAVSFALGNSMHVRGPWVALGLFGLLHDSPGFAITRLVVMTTSFILLFEAARLGLTELHWRAPGRWIYGPLASLVVVAAFKGGLADGNTMARYAIGLVGSTAMTLLLILYSRMASPSHRRWTIASAVGFALYGLAAGGVTPVVWFGAASVLSQNGFRLTTGIPIQLVRGLLACFIALSTWGMWGQEITRQVASQRYTTYWKQQLVWITSSMATIIICGWLLTDYLGGIYSQNVRNKGRGAADLLAGLLAAETASVAGVVESISGSPALIGLLAAAHSDSLLARALMQRAVVASAARLGYVMDRSGTVVASTDERLVGQHEAESSLFQAAVAGKAGYSYSFNTASGAKDSNVSYPIRDSDGEVLGVVLLTKSLGTFEALISRFDRLLFLVDADGLIVVTNQPNLEGRLLWPRSSKTEMAPHAQPGQPDLPAVTSNEIVDATWVVIDSERDFAWRHGVNYSGWSLVVLIRPEGIGASRALGIVITLLTAAISLVYLVGRERRVHDTVQSDKRLELEELARSLDHQASTDVLTGAFNRQRFDQELSSQIERSRRYDVPLSLILLDVDHFKSVNDRLGHLAGDKVLIQIASLTRETVRSGDIHARWGGEEFVVLAPGTERLGACQLAEKLRRTIEGYAFLGVGAITCSFGVVQFHPSDTAETLLARADGLLYRAKFNGRNRVEEAGTAPDYDPFLADPIG